MGGVYILKFKDVDVRNYFECDGVMYIKSSERSGRVVGDEDTLVYFGDEVEVV